VDLLYGCVFFHAQKTAVQVGKDASGRPMYDQTFESPTVLTSSMVSLTAWACDCCQCANDKTTIDVGRYGTVAAGNSFGVTGWCGKCVLYCDGVKADEYALWGSSDSGRAFPSQCTGAISVEIHGGGHCGGCEVKGSGLMINPWPKQPSLLDTGSESHTAPQRLSFDPNAGKWCLAGTCTEVDGRVQPIGLSSQSFDIAAVSDFDGVFQGKGVPKQGGGNAAALKARLRAIKTPKRPKAPKVPKLETFTPEEPTFASWLLVDVHVQSFSWLELQSRKLMKINNPIYSLFYFQYKTSFRRGFSIVSFRAFPCSLVCCSSFPVAQVVEAAECMDYNRLWASIQESYKAGSYMENKAQTRWALIK